MQAIIGRVLVAVERGGGFLSRVAGTGGAGWARVAPGLVGAFLWLPFLAGVVFVAESGMAGTPSEVWVGAGVAWAGLPLMRGWTREGVPGLPHLVPHTVRGSRSRWVLWAGVTVAATGCAWVSAPPVHPGRVLALMGAMAVARWWLMAKRGRIAPVAGRAALGAVVGAAVMPNQIRPSLGMVTRGGKFIAAMALVGGVAFLFLVNDGGAWFGARAEGITTAVLAGLVLPLTLVKSRPEVRLAGACQRSCVRA